MLAVRSAGKKRIQLANDPFQPRATLSSSALAQQLVTQMHAGCCARGLERDRHLQLHAFVAFTLSFPLA